LSLKQNELREQLRELASRRNQLLEQKAGATLAKTAELDARIATIDGRSAQLEQQLFATNDMINRWLTVDGQGIVVIPPPDAAAAAAARRAAKDATRNAVGFTVVALVAVYAIVRSAGRLFRGRRVPAIGDNSAQLAQLQQSIDVIAVEVERISEAQRYTSKILSERGIAAGPPNSLR
ncbi:MAG TPA: hypothetical protein VF483_05985, partial [Gemmatimonadaceae bacterium]